MKKIYSAMALCLATLASTTVLATNNDSDNYFAEMAGDSVRARTADTTRFHFGKREVIFDGNEIHFIKDRFYNDDFSESDDCTENNWCWGNEVRGFHSHLEGFDLGVTGFGSNKMSNSIDDEIGYMNLNENRSVQIAWNFTSVSLPMVNNKLAFSTGVGMKWDIYNFSTKNLSLYESEGKLQYDFDTTKAYDKSKMRVYNMVMPAVIEWQPGVVNRFFLIAGVEGNLRLGSTTKMVDSKGHKYKSHSNLALNQFSYNAFVRVGWDNFGIYGKANLSPLFKDGKGPELYPYSVGVSLML